MRPASSTRARLRALPLVLLLIAGNLAFMPGASAGLSPGTAGQAGDVQFVGIDLSPLRDPDNHGPLAPEAFGYGQAVGIRVTDDDLVNDRISVTVSSSSSSGTETITLERLGPQGGQPFGSLVQAGGYDRNLPVRTTTDLGGTSFAAGMFVFNDTDSSGGWSPGDRVYFSPNGTADPLGSFDVRIANPLSGTALGSRVLPGQGDFGNDKVSFGASVRVQYHDLDLTGTPTLPDTFYLDTDMSGTISVDDVQLSGDNAGVVVAALPVCADPTCPLTALPPAANAPAPVHRVGYVNDDANAAYGLGDRIVIDVHNDARLDEADVRLGALEDVVTYFGLVGFETTDVPNNGEIYVEADDSVTVRYFDNGIAGPGSSSGNRFDVLRWRESRDGEIRLDRDDYFGIGEEVEIIVEDKDIPVDLQRFCVHITSDSDERGFNMTLDRVSNGLYRGNLGFTTGESDSGYRESGSLADLTRGVNPCDYDGILDRDTAAPLIDPTPIPVIEVEHGDYIHIAYTTPGFDERGRVERAEVQALFHETYTGRVQWIAQDHKSVISESPVTPSAANPVRVVRGINKGDTPDTAGGWLRVEDKDLAGRGLIVVNVRSEDDASPDQQQNVDPTGLFVSLIETSFKVEQTENGGLRAKEFGRGSGEFIGWVGFHNDLTSPASRGSCERELTASFLERSSNCEIRVKENAVVIVRYDDEHDANGDEVVVESRVRWKPFVTGNLQFKTSDDYLTDAPLIADDEGYNTTWTDDPALIGDCDETASNNWDGNDDGDLDDDDLPCHPYRGYVELNDPDISGAGQVEVRLTSSRDALGVPLFLQETGANTGVFRAEFGFNSTYSSGSRTTWADQSDTVIFAFGCDGLKVAYLDQNDIAGHTTEITDVIQVLAPNHDPKNQSETCVDPRRPGDDGEGQVFGRSIDIRDSPASETGLAALYGYRSASIHLTDGNQNRNLLAVDQTNATVLVTTGSQPGRWFGNQAQDPLNAGDWLESATAQVINVTLNETDPDSAHFVGEFFLTAGPSQGPNVLHVEPGEEVCVYWLYRNASFVHHSVLADCVPWIEGDRSYIEFRSTEHQGTSMSNPLGIGPAARVFYNGTGDRWLYTQDTDTIRANQAYVFVRDTEENPDVDGTNYTDSVDIIIRSESFQDGINIQLNERYGRQALPRQNVSFGGFSAVANGAPYIVPGAGTPGTADYIPPREIFSFQDDRGFIGTFNFTTDLSRDRDWYDRFDTLPVRDGDTVTAFYQDPHNEVGDSQTLSAFVDWNETHTAVVTLDREIYRRHVDPNDATNTANIVIRDKDLDTSIAQQRISVLVENDRTGRQVCVELEETGGRSGVFTGDFGFTPNVGEGTSGDCAAVFPATSTPQRTDAKLEVRDEDTFTVTYVDFRDRFGRPQEINATATWFDLSSTRLTIDKPQYLGYGDAVSIVLEDVNLDTTARNDEVFVWVSGESDGAGEYLKLTETAPHSTVFNGVLNFEAERVAGNGKLFARDGDRFFVAYLDREIDELTASDDDAAVKQVYATFEALPNEPPQLTIHTLPSFNETLGYVPIYHPHELAGLGNRVAFWAEAEDADGEVVAFTLDFDDQSPLVTNVPERGPNPQVITLHEFGKQPWYEGRAVAPPLGDAYAAFPDNFTFNVKGTVVDDDGAVTVVTVPVRMIKPDLLEPDPIRVGTFFQVGDPGPDSIELEIVPVAGDTGCPDPICAPPDAYEVVVMERANGTFNASIASGGINVEEADYYHPVHNPSGFVHVVPPHQITYDPFPLAPKGGPVNQTIIVGGLKPSTNYSLAVYPVNDDPVRSIVTRDYDPITGEVAYNQTPVPFVTERDPLPNADNWRGFTGIGRGGAFKEATMPPGFIEWFVTGDLDTTPPPGPVLVTSTTHQPNLATTARNVSLAWSAVTDPDGSQVNYLYAFSNVPPDSFVLDDTTGQRTSSRTHTQNNVVPNTPGGAGYYFYITPCNSQAGCNDEVTSYGPLLIEQPAAKPDRDGDGIPDVDDNCIDTPNPLQTDTDKDGIGDLCELLGTLTPAKLAEANEGLDVKVTRQDGRNTITWNTAIADAVGKEFNLTVAGIQIWFANPDDENFTLLKTIRASDAEFGAGRYVHVGSTAGPDTRYKVTVFYGETSALGYSDGDPNDLSGFDTLAAVTPERAGGGGIPWWVWVVAGVVALLVIGLVIGVLVAKGRGEDDEMSEGADSWGAAGADVQDDGYRGFGEEHGMDDGLGDDGLDMAETEVEAAPEPTFEEPPGAPGAVPEEPGLDEPEDDGVDPLLHHLSCPSCGADFTAHGEKPMVTECPSCGVKGVLR